MKSTSNGEGLDYSYYITNCLHMAHEQIIDTWKLLQIMT